MNTIKWASVWAKDPSPLGEDFPKARSEDFRYFPIADVPRLPLPVASSSIDDSLHTRILSLLPFLQEESPILIVDGALSSPTNSYVSVLEDYDESVRSRVQAMHPDYFKAMSLTFRSSIIKITPDNSRSMHIVVAQTQNGLCAPQILLESSKEGSPDVHLHLVSLVDNQPNLFLPYIYIDMKAKTSLTLSQTAHMTPSSVLFMSMESAVSTDSTLNLHLAAWDGYKNRLYAASLLEGEGARAQYRGAVISGKNHQCEIFTRIFHKKPRTISDQFFKAIAQDGGHFSFNGDILVSPHTPGVKAYQLSKNLLLDKGSRLFSRPQLHVEHDDLECSHGSTIGGLSEEEQFYLQSRGISKESSYHLLLRSFLADILMDFPCENKTCFSLYQTFLHQIEKKLL